MSAHPTQAPGPAAGHHEGALGPYLRALRAHKLVVLLVTLAAVAAAVAWVVLRSPSYEAEAEILVTPVPADDATFLGVQVLRDSGEATRTVQTAAGVVDSQAAARATAAEVGAGYTPERVADAIEVQPQGESNILAVTATAGDPETAARLANGFAEAALVQRRRAIRRQVALTIERLSARQEGAASSDLAEVELAQRVSALEAVRDGSDPTLSLTEEAQPPLDPLEAPPWLIIALALLAGFALGTAAAVAIEYLDRRVGDLDEIEALWPLPVLAFVPEVPRRMRNSLQMPPPVRESYRTLALQVEQRLGGRGAVMITSPSSQDGKTTSSVNLSLSLVAGGHRVILLDFDLRKPGVGPIVGVRDTPSLLPLLDASTRLSALLTPAPSFPSLQVLPVGEGDAVLVEALARRFPDILEEARAAADFVIIDTPPLGEVGDALRFTALVDAVVVTVRPRSTSRGGIHVARDLVARSGVEPFGLIVVGETPAGVSPYYTYGPVARGGTLAGAGTGGRDT